MATELHRLCVTCRLLKFDLSTVIRAWWTLILWSIAHCKSVAIPWRMLQSCCCSAVHTKSINIKQNDRKPIPFSNYGSINLDLSLFFCFESLNMIDQLDEVLSLKRIFH